MSIPSEINRIVQNISDSLDAVAAKGVTVPSGSNSDDLPNLISQITGPQPTYQAKTHITPTESSQTITPDTGYDALSSVQIDGIDSEYIGSEVPRRTGDDISVGVSNFAVPRGYYESNVVKMLTAGSVTAPASISGSSANVNAANNVLTLSKTISVTPQVTTQGYVFSGTAGNSEVSLSASIRTLAAATIPPKKNGSSIPAGSYLVGAQTISPALEFEEGTYTPASNASRPTISFSNSHTATPIFVAMVDTSSNSTITGSSNLVFIFLDVYRFTGVGYPYDTSSIRNGIAAYVYKTSASTTLASVQVTNNSDNTGDSSTDYARYWLTPSGFKPSSNSTSRVWRSGRTYKWIAVWAPAT